MSLELITAPNLRNIEGLMHAFTTRHGGVSAQEYASLNLGFSNGDDDESVEKNYEILCQETGIPRDGIALSRQVHGKECVLVDKNTDLDELAVAEADALITREPGIFLGIRVADCYPIFVVDTKQRWLANVHAGWRGTLDGVLENTIQIMIQKLNARPSDLIVAIGPGISMKHFEVSFGVANLFKESKNFKNAEIVEKEDSAYIDLESINARQALQCSIPANHVWKSGLCTYAEAKKFYSYRRDGKKSGRTLGVIGWRS